MLVELNIDQETVKDRCVGERLSSAVCCKEVDVVETEGKYKVGDGVVQRYDSDTR
jgi:hypothetical protein